MVSRLRYFFSRTAKVTCGEPTPQNRGGVTVSTEIKGKSCRTRWTCLRSWTAASSGTLKFPAHEVAVVWPYGPVSNLEQWRRQPKFSGKICPKIFASSACASSRSERQPSGIGNKCDAKIQAESEFWKSACVTLNIGFRRKYDLVVESNDVYTIYSTRWIPSYLGQCYWMKPVFCH